jgi:hypothetical protein
MHSAYENAIFDLIKRLVMYEPEPWLKHIENKQVPFEKVRSTIVSAIQSDLFGDWLAAVEREPLPKKVDRVLAALRPGSLKDVVQGFDFDMEELKKIDQLRHDVTHKPNFANPIQDVTGKLRFLHCTVLLLEKLAEQKYPGKAGGGVSSSAEPIQCAVTGGTSRPPVGVPTTSGAQAPWGRAR